MVVLVKQKDGSYEHWRKTRVSNALHQSFPLHFQFKANTFPANSWRCVLQMILLKRCALLKIDSQLNKNETCMQESLFLGLPLFLLLMLLLLIWLLKFQLVMIASVQFLYFHLRSHFCLKHMLCLYIQVSNEQCAP